MWAAMTNHRGCSDPLFPVVMQRQLQVNPKSENLGPQEEDKKGKAYTIIFGSSLENISNCTIIRSSSSLSRYCPTPINKSLHHHLNNNHRMSLLQSIPPTTANKQTQAQKQRGSRARKLLGANAKRYRLELKLKLRRLVSKAQTSLAPAGNPPPQLSVQHQLRPFSEEVQL